MELKEKIRRLVLEQVEAGKEFGNSDFLFAEGILTSLELASLISALEEEFSISIIPDEVDEENFASVNALTQFIEGKTS